MATPFLFFTDENVANGLPGGEQFPVQSGINDTDPGTLIDEGFDLPWVIDPERSWLNWRCSIEIELDSGIAIHKPLPQGDYTQDLAFDELGIADIASPAYISLKDKGVNTISHDTFTDIAQKMATSAYRFVLRGWAARAGYQVPIPKLVSVGGVRVVPGARQWAVNDLVGNYCGVPVFLGQWELWYHVTSPPTASVLPPSNMANHIRADAQLPDGMQVPYSPPDSNSVTGPTSGPNNPQQ